MIRHTKRDGVIFYLCGEQGRANWLARLKPLVGTQCRVPLFNIGSKTLFGFIAMLTPTVGQLIVGHKNNVFPLGIVWTLRGFETKDGIVCRLEDWFRLADEARVIKQQLALALPTLLEAEYPMGPLFHPWTTKQIPDAPFLHYGHLVRQFIETVDEEPCTVFLSWETGKRVYLCVARKAGVTIEHLCV
jgi:hypothetical protein